MADPAPVDDKNFDMKQRQEDEAAIDEGLAAIPVPEEAQPTEVAKTESKPEELPSPEGTKPEPDDFETKLNAVEIDKNAHPNVRKGIEATREFAKAEHKAKLEYEAKAKEYEKKVKEYEEQLKNPPIPKEIQEKISRLEQLQRDVDIRQDPEFQQKYVQGLKNNEESIIKILTEAGLTPDTAEWIQNRGGVLAMSQSQRQVDANTTEAEWIENKLLANTPTFHKTRVMNRITESLELQDKMQQELQDSAKNFPERQKQKLEDAAKLFEEGRTEALTAIGELAKKREIQPADTPEIKQAKTKHNQRVDKADKAFQEYLKTGNSPKVAAKLLVQAVQSEALLERNQELENEVQDLRQKYEKVKSAGRTSNIGTPPLDSKPTEPSKKDLLNLTDNQAADRLLKEMESKRQ